MTDSKENTKEKSKKPSKNEMEEFKKKVKKDKKSSTNEDIGRKLATRELLERDFNEDCLKVSFNTSPDTRRAIMARKPNQEEFLKILALSVEASSLENQTTDAANKRLIDVYGKLNKLAADLSTDETLDEEFWKENVSFQTLQNFITELILAFQRGGALSEEDLESFR